MTEQPILSPDIISQIGPKRPEPEKYPYFLIAYWPRDKRWAIHKGLYPDPECLSIQDAIDGLEQSGWQYITIMHLPAELWERA